MLKNLVVVLSVISVIGTGAISIIDNMNLDIAEVKTEFYEDNSEEFTTEQKNSIWNKAWEVVEEDLSDLDFGGNSYNK